jgi:crotonobetainyl-CoA:carnitine CoA-transferase CaiB-like acyl-CoA transferase
MLHGQRASSTKSVQEIDLSLFEPLFSILGPQAAEFELTGSVVERSGSRSPTHAPRNVYRTKDRQWVALSAAMEGTLGRLFDGIGYPEGRSDPRFSTHEARLRNADALDGLIQEYLEGLSLEEALTFFSERDITAGPVCDIADLVEHPFVQNAGLLVKQETPDGRSVSVHAPPYKINGKRPAIRREAPSLGQDNGRWLQDFEDLPS